MGFIQIIEYETDKPDEIQALAAERAENDGEKPRFARLTATRDRDRPNRYRTIVEFDSYEVAMENSRDPETNEFAVKMAELCTGPPTFYNLDVIMTRP